MLLAIDPDTKLSGVACFTQHKGLYWVMLCPPFKLSDTWRTPELVIEKPRIYPGVPNIDANDLIDLSEVVGWWRGKIAHDQYAGYTPQEWKGQVSKPVHHDRIWQVLTPSERARFPAGTGDKIAKWLTWPPKKQKNIRDPVLELLDACALGMFHLKRVARGGTTYRP